MAGFMSLCYRQDGLHLEAWRLKYLDKNRPGTNRLVAFSGLLLAGLQTYG
jgi:hypothetical protein